MKISIVTISYNQSAFLRQAIESILDQKYPDLEYTVVDPGSTDGSKEIIESYGTKISKVLYGPDAGPADGLNKGFAAATGEIFGFLNSDDVLLPGALRAAADYFSRNPKVDVVSGHTYITDVDGNRSRKSHSDRFDLDAVAYGSAVLMQQSTFFRAEIYRKAGGFNINNKVAWDGELYIDMALKGASFALVDCFWSEFRLHGASITSSMRLDMLFRQYKAQIFQKVMGRQFSARDYLPFILYRLRKHARNLKGLYERIAHGPIYGRDANRQSPLKKFLGHSFTKDLRALKKSGVVQRNLTNPVIPIARWLAFQALYLGARVKCLIGRPLDEHTTRAAYIIGSGRSGTTILGETLEGNTNVRYFFEPVYLWRVVAEETDVTEFFGHGKGKAIFGSEVCTHQARRRFQNLTRPGLLESGKLFLEKTPHNAWRIGFIEALNPGSKFIHIVRDGMQVANSIRQIADGDTYKVAFMRQHNTWWGLNDAKWHHLARDCTSQGVVPSEIAQISGNFQRGAVEWLVSLQEIDRWREQLGKRLLEIRLDELCAAPKSTLETVCSFLGISVAPAWVENAARQIHAIEISTPPSELVLPERLCQGFNAQQEKWGFAGRAIPATSYLALA